MELAESLLGELTDNGRIVPKLVLKRLGKPCIPYLSLPSILMKESQREMVPRNPAI